MKKLLIIIGGIVIVIVALLAGYYIGYSVTEPETQVSSPDVTGTADGGELNTIVLTAEEINSILSQVVAFVAGSGLPVKLNYATARLTEDAMVLAVSAEAMGMKVESESIEVRFQGTEVTVSGKIPLGGMDTNINVQMNTSINDGKLAVAIEDIKPAAVSLALLYGKGIDREELNQYLNGKLAEMPFSLPFQELEDIAIEGGKLIISGR